MKALLLWLSSLFIVLLGQCLTVRPVCALNVRGLDGPDAGS